MIIKFVRHNGSLKNVGVRILCCGTIIYNLARKSIKLILLCKHLKKKTRPAWMLLSSIDLTPNYEVRLSITLAG